MKVRKKKIRLKKWLSTTLIIIPILILLLIGLINIKKIAVEKALKESQAKEQKMINNIINTINDDQIDKKFIDWIIKNYGISTIKKLNTHLKEEEYKSTIWHKITNNSLIVLQDLYKENYKNLKNIKQIKANKNEVTLSFIGDVSLADNWYIAPKYDERRKKIYGILSEEVVNIMTKSDIMVANSEFTVSDRGEKMPNKYYTFRASPQRLSIYEEMGIDLVTLANNHVYDFGETAFYDMLQAFEDYEIPYIGAGRNINDAKKPYYFIINGYKIAFVNATRAEKYILTPEATETTGGVLRCYDPKLFVETIKETKLQSDYVVALIHWGKEDSHELENVQKETSKTYIDAGADVIVGTHAHVLQGIEYYKDKPIIYNLGDFIFNNETKDTGIFQIKINNDGKLEYYFIPCLEKDEYTKTLDKEEKQRVIQNMNSWSINAKIDENGKITKIE